MRIRFRRPLRPAVQAELTGTISSIDDTGADLGISLSAFGDVLVTTTARVTR